MQARENARSAKTWPLSDTWSSAFRIGGGNMKICFNMAVWGFSRPSTALIPPLAPRFPPTPCRSFSAEIRRYLRDDGSLHVARSIKENARRVEEEREKTVRETGREPTVEEIAHRPVIFRARMCSWH